MIVGVLGKAGAGKDTFGEILVRRHGFVRMAFADPMKRFCMEVFDFSKTQLWGASEYRNEPDRRYYRGKVLGDFEEGKDSYLTPRKALQFLGTEVGRELYPNVWVEYGLRQAKRLLENDGLDYLPEAGIIPARRVRPSGVVFTDVRFENEVAAIRKVGEVIKIVRPGAGLSGSAAVHPSETEMEKIPLGKFARLIENDGTIEDLELEARVYVGT